jgi:hypothetical protein
MSMTSPKASLASFLNVPIPASVTTNLRTRQTAGRLPLSARSAHSSEKFPTIVDCGSVIARPGR